MPNRAEESGEITLSGFISLESLEKILKENKTIQENEKLIGIKSVGETGLEFKVKRQK